MFIAHLLSKAARAVTTLGLHRSYGLGGELVTTGPYRYSRNPQYVGLILAYTGIILIADSKMALAAGSLFILWLVLAPLSEEPWLRRQFGKRYDDYQEQVPRFIGLKSLYRRQA